MPDAPAQPPLDAPRARIDPERPRLEPEPTHRPEPRFWPYLDLAEQPSEEELAALDPDLRIALSRTGVGGTGGWNTFSLTLAFPRFDGPGYERAVALARASRQYLETGAGDDFRVRARFQPDDALGLRELYQLVGDRPGTDVLIDDRPVPYARELWLPLFWCLLPR